MGRAPCCSKVGLNKGPWSTREDALLVKYIQTHGEGQWRFLAEKAGLLRCGKSCRLRWLNYLRPGILRGNITPDEEDLIIRLHSLLGNRWSLIAGRLPGRTDNEIKNYWNSHLSKRFKNTAAAGSDQKKNEQDSGNEEMTKIKVHFPKAIRVSPFSITRRNGNDSMVSGSSSHGEGNNGVYTEILNLTSWSWSGLNYDGFDPSCQNFEPTNDDMFNKIYEDYKQLLNSEGIEDRSC